MRRVLGDGGWCVAMMGVRTTLRVRAHDEQFARNQMRKRFQIAQNIAAICRTRLAATKQSYKRKAVMNEIVAKHRMRLPTNALKKGRENLTGDSLCILAQDRHAE